jgi:ribose transport system ATP-binding protein
VRAGDCVGPFRNPRQAIAAGLMMLPEDRKLDGLLLERCLRENVTLACHKQVARGGFFRRRVEVDLVRRLMADLRIRAVSSETRAATLSGGNQQKLLMARCLALPLRVLLLDEPTRGVDVGGKYEIHALINRMAADGMATVMVSSELPEVIGMCDRIGMMHEGGLVGVLDNHNRGVTQEDILRMAWGLARSEGAA